VLHYRAHIFFKECQYTSYKPINCTVKQKRRIINPRYAFMTFKTINEPGLRFQKPFFFEKVGRVCVPLQILNPHPSADRVGSSCRTLVYIDTLCIISWQMWYRLPRSTVTDSVYGRKRSYKVSYTTVFRHKTCDRITIVFFPSSYFCCIRS
jgi:hypothetical protein